MDDDTNIALRACKLLCGGVVEFHHNELTMHTHGLATVHWHGIAGPYRTAWRFEGGGRYRIPMDANKLPGVATDGWTKLAHTHGMQRWPFLFSGERNTRETQT